MIEPLNIIETAPGIWTVTWDGVTPPGDLVDVWLYGALIAEGVTTGSVSVQHPGCPPLELVGAGVESESALAGPVAMVCWRGVGGADRYLVQRRAQGATAWRTVATYAEEGRGNYLWRGRLEEDGAVLEYRVTAERKGGSVGGEVMVWPVVRHPAAPVVSVSVVAGPKLRVAAGTGGGSEL
jgi:hypothetical protein